jgi:hypothetical protein
MARVVQVKQAYRCCMGTWQAVAADVQWDACSGLVLWGETSIGIC